MLTEQILRRGLKTRTIGSKIYTFDSIDSTNNCARALASCFAPEGTVVHSEFQTAGRGRLGRAWEARPNENLTFSLILRPGKAPVSVNLLPLLVAVAVGEAVKTVTGLDAECKWPNDLLIGGKKFAGILLEGSLKDDELEFVVVGIGINVNQDTFPGELVEKATSLRLATGQPVDREELFKVILERLEAHYVTMKPDGFGGVLPLWQSMSTMTGKRVSVLTGGDTLTGVVRGISSEGGLILGTSGNERTVFAGDVTVVGIEPGSLNAPGN
jgi:BirA family transcriptional regulator, biotin operon repressor / biotin---[acetyl-CoA-carboxylase] ligase